MTRGGRLAIEGAVRQTRVLFRAPVEIVIVTDRGPIVRQVPLSGRETPFSFPISARPKAVLLDPDYKLLSWLPEFEDGPMIQAVASLRSLGRGEVALKMLDAYLDSIPDAMDALYQAGRCLQDGGDLAGAEERYRRVADRYDLYPCYAPAVPPSFLHLGQVLDLQGRRADAVDWYRRAAGMPDAPTSRAEAEALLQAPYVAPPRATPPPPDTLRTYAGDYAGAPVGELEVRYSELGLQAKSLATGLRTYLLWAGGSQFHAVVNESITFEFLRDGGRTTGVKLHFFGHDFVLIRHD